MKSLKKQLLKNNVKEKSEFQLASTLDKVRALQGMVAFIPDGELLDVDNVKSYKAAFEIKLSR